MSDCGCHIEIKDTSQKKILFALLAINFVMFVVELTVGVIAQSTGVLADSLDMLADAMVYGISLYAVGRCNETKRKAALWSGCFQVAIAGGILLDIVRRIVFGSEPSALLMFVVACIAITANTICFFIISKQKSGEVHMRASYIFSRNDVLANSGVIIASILVYFTGSHWPDILIGISITE